MEQSDDQQPQQPATPSVIGRPRLFPGIHRQATPAQTPPAHAESEAREQARDDLQANLSLLVDAAHTQRETLIALHQAMSGMVALLRDAARPGRHISISIGVSNRVKLDSEGYRYSYLMLAATQSVTFLIPGLGPVTRSLSADWNRLDYPDGTELYLASGSNVNALLYLTNDAFTV